MLLFHIAHRVDWDAAGRAGEYRAASLDGEGFIHLSTAEQVCDTAARYYTGEDDVLLLTVDVARLTAALKWEESPHGGTYPHLYGPLDVRAVRTAVPWGPEPDGTWHLP